MAGGNTIHDKQEGWPSGLRRTPGKRVGVKAPPGFESPSLRHTPSNQVIFPPSMSHVYPCFLGTILAQKIFPAHWHPALSEVRASTAPKHRLHPSSQIDLDPANSPSNTDPLKGARNLICQLSKKFALLKLRFVWKTGIKFKKANADISTKSVKF